MVLIVSAIVGTLVLVYAVWPRKRDTVSERPHIPLMGIQIVCSECGGDDRVPKRTFLSADRHSCDSCGSTSYALASTFYPTLILPEQSQTTAERAAFDAKAAKQGQSDRWVN